MYEYGVGFGSVDDLPESIGNLVCCRSRLAKFHFVWFVAGVDWQNFILIGLF
jgi:hypothetical protein